MTTTRDAAHNNNNTNHRQVSAHSIPAKDENNNNNKKKIPKKLHQSWITSVKEMPEKMATNVKAWKGMNSDYDYVYFNDNDQRKWMKRNCKEYWPAWRDMLLPAGRADLFRYCLLYTEGGVWADIDIQPKLPLHDFIWNAQLVVVHDGGMKAYGEIYLYNAFLASVPGHPALKRAMDIVYQHYMQRLKEPAVKCTGPGVLWRGLNDTLANMRPFDFVGYDQEQQVDFLHFDGTNIRSREKGIVLFGKYGGYLDDAKTHGGEPHYGRQVTWASNATAI